MLEVFVRVGRFRVQCVLAAVLAFVFCSHAVAQTPPPPLSVPAHFPLNPMAVARTSLHAQPYVDRALGWSHELSIDYGSAVEWEDSKPGARYVLDAELLRVQIGLRHDISPRRFFQAVTDVNGVFNGFADAAFDWYHSTMGISFHGREVRPRNQFEYRLSLPGGVEFQRTRPDYFLGDLRLVYGMRHSAKQQTTLTLILPTSTAPVGYSKETISTALIHTFRTAVWDAVSFEATAGIGYTPQQGELAGRQHEFLNSASVGARVRVFGRQSIYGYLFTHSAMFHGTTLAELERRELTGDIGWAGRTADGREWRIGLTEDFGPKDAGIDLILRAGISW